MKEKCHEYTIYGETDTAGQPIKHWKCYCGTTACLKNYPIQNLASITTIQEKEITELTPEEEERFYKKVFNPHLHNIN